MITWPWFACANNFILSLCARLTLFQLWMKDKTNLYWVFACQMTNLLLLLFLLLMLLLLFLKLLTAEIMNTFASLGNSWSVHLIYTFCGVAIIITYRLAITLYTRYTCLSTCAMLFMVCTRSISCLSNWIWCHHVSLKYITKWFCLKVRGPILLLYWIIRRDLVCVFSFLLSLILMLCVLLHVLLLLLMLLLCVLHVVEILLFLLCKLCLLYAAAKLVKICISNIKRATLQSCNFSLNFLFLTSITFLQLHHQQYLPWYTKMSWTSLIKTYSVVNQINKPSEVV